MCNRASRREELEGEQRDVAWNGKQGEHGLICVDGCNEKSGEVLNGRWRMEVWAIMALMKWDTCGGRVPYLWANSLILSCANPRT